jgi:hypothetical protein
VDSMKGWSSSEPVLGPLGAPRGRGEIDPPGIAVATDEDVDDRDLHPGP